LRLLAAVLLEPLQLNTLAGLPSFCCIMFSGAAHAAVLLVTVVQTHFPDLRYLLKRLK
jgi:hypothetical protein